ncbi:MAG: tRNA (adenosine(37)-N6)-dimethylallyltransferase MiaA [Bacteroidales bacterium]|nr:tRNA (adenosine(37)-N6)-dimethylallyltransferase MiaA [Bacteroidales bacterium]
MSRSLVVIGGPTAVGKTSVAITLAKKYHSEIISADSRQIYKETKIGTAVPSPEELLAVPHHFIQTINLTNYYNASMYELDALEKIENLFRKHDIVIMTGGSGLYINAVCFGIDELPTIDQEIRSSLAIQFRDRGLKSIQDDLKKADPVTYERVDLNNHFRILKALEVTRQTGLPYSSFLTQKHKKRNFRIIRLGLDMNRETLYRRINNRVDSMIDSGLIEEVKSLEQFREKNAMKTVGYRELFSYLDGRISLEQAVDLIKRNTRKYARKQLTWFRKNNLYPWFHPAEMERIETYIDSQLNRSA